MLHIYYGRESLNKEKFMYEQIRRRGYGLEHPVLVIVPDQYTLEAERQAFQWLEKPALLGLEISSMSRLGHRILSELGGAGRAFVDKYGRQMLLTRIVRDMEEDLLVFRGRKASSSFVEMVNNFISELKQYGVSPEALEEIRDRIPEKELLHRKLTDLGHIYRRYQEEIEGKYTDSEDYVDLFVGKIGQSRILRGASVWVYGFDSFAPKSMEVLRGIMAAAAEVNVVLTLDRGCRDAALFGLTEAVLRNLLAAAEECGCERGEILPIDDSYAEGGRVQGIAHLEKELYAIPKDPAARHEGITLVEAANIYNEAESAAAFVLHLLRDKGYRKRDIVLVCNDLANSGQVIDRVFQEYGLPVFHDNKRSITDSPVASFLLSMLEVVHGKWKTRDIIRTLKAGFVELPAEEIERLEIYAGRYRIRGSMWKKEFLYGTHEYGDDGLWELNCTREKVCALFQGLERIVSEAETVREFAEKYYAYLTEDLEMDAHLQALVRRQEEAGLGDLAEETEQIFRMVLHVLDQIVELIGEDPFRLEEFLEIFQVGLEQIQIGILPVSVDDLLMGTMQRTRTGKVRALVVMGANDGVLPCQVEDTGLFALSEIDRIYEEGFEICKVDSVRRNEEQLAIYRNLSRPSDHLWISWSAAGTTGEAMTRSELIDDILQVFPGIPVEPDVVNAADALELIGGPMSTLRHMVEYRRHHKGAGTAGEAGLWAEVADWYREHDPAMMEKVEQGLDFRNAPDALQGRSTVLFGERGGIVSLSPSRLETYARCPFRYFLQYGLHPKEDRTFEISPLELGDIYHLCFMKVAEELTSKALWETVDRQTCASMVECAVNEIAAEYRDGLMGLSNEEKYRTRRIKDTCAAAIWMLILQVREGKIDHSLYELPFGARRPLPPIELKRGDQTLYIEGKIDRMDVLKSGRVNIIDYKSGDNQLKKEEIQAGYRLQLMLYMKAASGEEREPAGMFYFHIYDPRFDAEKLKKGGGDSAEQIQEQLRKAFFLKGILVDEGDNVEAIAGTFEKQSLVTAISNSKGGLKGTSASLLMTESEFHQLAEAVDEKLDELADQMLAGEIPISPMRSGNRKPCDFCDYQSVCRFDTAFEGCQYRWV